MKIKTLLWSGFAAICAVMAVLVSIGIWQLNVIDKAADEHCHPGESTTNRWRGKLPSA
jgi:hypothetical protein